MARTPVLVRFDPDQLARVDAFAEKSKVARSVAISTLIEGGLNRPLATGGIVKPSKLLVVGARPSEQTVRREAVQARPKSILDGLDIADAPRRPAPGSMLKKGK